ncbi:tyrosine-type recombinase/integrase [Motilibacter deserti]|nr:site-specific integrase [Motilibacter deserti]
MDWTDPVLAKTTIAEWADHWVTTLHVAPSTLDSYRSILRGLVIPRWGALRLDQVTFTAVQSWVAGMTGAKGQLLSASRRRHAAHLLTAMLDAAVADGRLPKNPARPQGGAGRKGMLPKLPATGGHRYLRHEELQKLAAHAASYETLVLVLGYCGVRWGEAAALRVRSVDLLRGRLLVTESVSEVEGGLSYGPTKTHQARTVPVPSFLRKQLDALMEGKSPDDLLFTSPEGASLRNGNFRKRVFLPAIKASGLPALRIHDLRHTAASLAVASGANVKAVQKMLGHASATMTLDTYADLFDDELDAIAERMDERAAQARADSLRTADGSTLVSLPASEVQQVADLRR